MTRVFVTGTGRCGTATFAKACQHVHGFTAGHETRKGEELLDPVYPDDHIEVDPHLVWILPDLLERYPDARWAILSRDREDTIRSLARRPSLKRWANVAFNQRPVPALDAAAQFFDFVEHHLWASLPDPMRLTTPVSERSWDRFLAMLDATADPVVPVILATVHNAGGPS